MHFLSLLLFSCAAAAAALGWNQQQALWNQLLSRHRLSLRSSTWGQEVVRSSPARTEDEIRVNLIREAVRCLYDPKCSGRGQVEGSSRRKGVGKKHRVATTNRTKNFGGGNAVGKIKTISPLVKSCSPTRRLQKMTKVAIICNLHYCSSCRRVLLKILVFSCHFFLQFLHFLLCKVPINLSFFISFSIFPKFTKQVKN